MAITRDLIRQIRALDAYDLRRLQMLIRGLLMDPDTGGEGASEQVSRGSVTFRRELVSCGKKTCTKCPHGPYWYAYWREDGRVRSRYVGKHLPGQAESDAGDDRGAPSPSTPGRPPGTD